MLNPDRQGKLTSSRIAPLMTGDKEEIMTLYRVMIGEEEEENLDHNFQVQLGKVTERLNLDWYEMKTGRWLERRGTFVVHPEKDWAGSTLDGFDPVLGCPIEAKHVAGREPMDIIIDRYQPQIHWQMFVTRTDQCAFSVIMGTNDPVVTYVPRDWDYLSVMIDRAERFMYHVGMRTPPVTFDLPLPAPNWDDMLIRDMTGNNDFATHAGVFLETRKAARDNESSKKCLKSIIEPNEREIHGYGVRVTRARNNALLVRPVKEESNDE